MKESLPVPGMKFTLAKRLAAEGIGTLFLLAAVVGSGIMAENLAAGNTAVALLANTLATSAMLIILILSFAPLSGAHFNPVVSLVMTLRKQLSWNEFFAYAIVQIVTAMGGVVLAHLMFELPILSGSTHDRSGIAKMISEVVATFGLVSVILSCVKHRQDAIPFAVAAYIGSAYWFTASTSFANPAVTLARAFTNTFSGIRLTDVPGFVLAQIVGGLLAMLLFDWFYPTKSYKTNL